MGNEAAITHATFPKQGSHLNKRVEVCFHYDTDHVVMGTIVRDDAEVPWLTIIQLDCGRIILGAECQYMPILEGVLDAVTP